MSANIVVLSWDWLALFHTPLNDLLGLRGQTGEQWGTRYR